MKNLVDLKRRLAKAQVEKTHVDFIYELNIHYMEHPFKDKYPYGVKFERKEYLNSAIGKVQSTQFSRVYNESESWMQFGSAKNWSFPDENTAVWTQDQSYEPQWRGLLTLTYKFLES